MNFDMFEITSIRQPEQGAVMLMHCDKCRSTEIVVNEYATKPKDGDAWMVNMPCMHHAVEMASVDVNSVHDKQHFLQPMAIVI
jgi:hypothetical protein